MQMTHFGGPGQYIAQGAPSQQMAPMTIPKAVVRIGEQAFWSTYQWADGAQLANTTNELFSTPIGQGGQGIAVLSIAETNMRRAGATPAELGFTVYGIAGHVYALDTDGGTNTSPPIVYADMATFVNHCVLEWRFVQVSIEICPLVLAGAGGGVFGTTADTGATDGGTGSREAFNNGPGSLWVYQFHPTLLPANGTFGINARFGNSAPVVDGGASAYNARLRVMMTGVYESAIAVG